MDEKVLSEIIHDTVTAEMALLGRMRMVIESVLRPALNNHDVPHTLLQSILAPFTRVQKHHETFVDSLQSQEKMSDVSARFYSFCCMQLGLFQANEIGSDGVYRADPEIIRTYQEQWELLSVPDSHWYQQLHARFADQCAMLMETLHVFGETLQPHFNVMEQQLLVPALHMYHVSGRIETQFNSLSAEDTEDYLLIYSVLQCLRAASPPHHQLHHAEARRQAQEIQQTTKCVTVNVTVEMSAEDQMPQQLHQVHLTKSDISVYNYGPRADLLYTLVLDQAVVLPCGKLCSLEMDDSTLLSYPIRPTPLVPRDETTIWQFSNCVVLATSQWVLSGLPRYAEYSTDGLNVYIFIPVTKIHDNVDIQGTQIRDPETGHVLYGCIRVTLYISNAQTRDIWLHALNVAAKTSKHLFNPYLYPKDLDSQENQASQPDTQKDTQWLEEAIERNKHALKLIKECNYIVQESWSITQTQEQALQQNLHYIETTLEQMKQQPIN